MKRFHAAALAAVLAVPAWAQQPAAKPETITLSGQDGKPHTCKVLRTYKDSSGATVCEVRDQLNGEILTVIEDVNPETVKAANKSEPVVEPIKPVDPILQPKEFAAPKAQEQFGPTPVVVPALPANQYTRPPEPAPRRWFNWFRSEPAPKPPADEILAVYHPDPVIRLIGSMSDDLLPSMREVSAETLARTAKSRPEVVEAMIRTVQTDPAPSVRVCCCRCLVEMQIRSPECVSALKALEDDREESVRTAAAAALSVLEMQ
jgi:HEAT repeats